MNWVDIMSQAIDYIEKHMTEDITISKVAKEVGVSPLYFQKCFSLLCGYSLSEYVRKRKLTLAGIELLSSSIKVIDLAIKYGYDIT